MRDLTGFSVKVETAVDWGDMDALQHVNNAVYFRYFENVRLAYFERAGILSGEMPAVGPILGSIACRFRAPLTYPDRITLAARVTSLEADRFVVEHAVYSERIATVAAHGEGLVVAFDYGAQRKAQVPAAWSAAITNIEGHAVHASADDAPKAGKA